MQTKVEPEGDPGFSVGSGGIQPPSLNRGEPTSIFPRGADRGIRQKDLSAEPAAEPTRPELQKPRCELPHEEGTGYLFAQTDLFKQILLLIQFQVCQTDLLLPLPRN